MKDVWENLRCEKGPVLAQGALETFNVDTYLKISLRGDVTLPLFPEQKFNWKIVSEIMSACEAYISQIINASFKILMKLLPIFVWPHRCLIQIHPLFLE